jgi:triacylglycerol esterase/lipase EstA (alpha/beta hydrolase family)
MICDYFLMRIISFKQIFKYYSNIDIIFNSPTCRQLIIIGHSMGGLIARRLLSMRGFDSSRIAAIITIATPHYPAGKHYFYFYC